MQVAGSCNSRGHELACPAGAAWYGLHGKLFVEDLILVRASASGTSSFVKSSSAVSTGSFLLSWLSLRTAACKYCASAYLLCQCSAILSENNGNNRNRRNLLHLQLREHA